MLWLIAIVAALNLAALAVARALARADRVPRWLVPAAAISAGVSTAIALWSVHLVRDAFAVSAAASPSERSRLLAAGIAHSIDVALVALVIAAVTLAVLVAAAIRQRKPRRPAGAVEVDG